MRNRVTGVLFRVRAKVKDDSHNTGDLTPDPDKGKWDQAKTRTAGDDDFRTFYCYRTSVSAHLEELLKLEPTLSEKGISIASTVKELRNAGVKVYENGYMYYMHWIKDQNYKYFWNYPNESDEGDTFHYYAVLRNTRYEVNVTDVEEIGMDLPGREVDQHGDIIEGRDYMLYPVFKDGGYDFEMDEKTLQELKNKAI